MTTTSRAGDLSDLPTFARHVRLPSSAGWLVPALLLLPVLLLGATYAWKAQAVGGFGELPLLDRLRLDTDDGERNPVWTAAVWALPVLWLTALVVALVTRARRTRRVAGQHAAFLARGWVSPVRPLGVSVPTVFAGQQTSIRLAAVRTPAVDEATFERVAEQLRGAAAGLDREGRRRVGAALAGLVRSGRECSAAQVFPGVPDGVLLAPAPCRAEEVARVPGASAATSTAVWGDLYPVR